MNHGHYFRDIPKGVTKMDIYRFLDMFEVTCPVAQHVIKKAVAAGQRGHKDLRTDWSNIVDSAQRKLQMMDEVVPPMELYTNGQPVEPATDPRWVQGEKRMEQIGPNGPTAEHYIDPHG